MNILLITEYFPPEIGAGSIRAFENSRRWVENGVNVTVITGFPDYPDGIIPLKYKGFKFYTEEIDGINVIRTFTIPAPNKGFFRRVLSFFSFLFSSVIQGTWASGKQDILIATSPPFFVGIAGYLISRLKGIPFIFEIRDLWPESIIQLGQLKNKIIIKMLESGEKFLYKKSSHLITVANSTVEVLIKKGVRKNKITVIKNGFNSKDIALKKINLDLKKELGLIEKFVVTYIGTIGLSHSIDTIIKAAKMLETQKKINFLIIGDGAERDNVIKLTHLYNLSNVIFIKKINREEIADFYSISDILLVTLKNLPLFKKVIPSKIFEIMAFSKPILISVDGEARNIVEEAKAGIFINPEDPSDLKKNILILMENDILRQKLSSNGKIFVEKFYNRENLADNYLSLLYSLLNNK